MQSLAYRRDGRALASVTIATVILLADRILFAKSLALACAVNVPFGDLLLIIPILWIIVMLPITIGGLGVQDARLRRLDGPGGGECAGGRRHVAAGAPDQSRCQSPRRVPHRFDELETRARALLMASHG